MSAELPADDARRMLGLPGGHVVLLLGRLVPQKGIDTLLGAVPALLRSHPDATVVLAGTRTGWSGLATALDGLGGDAARIVVREDFDESDRDALLAAADVVVMPSREESFGLVILEAWAAGRAVVASDLPSIGSYMRDDVDGVLVEPRDVDGWAAAISALLDDPARRARLGQAGRARIASEFEWARVVERWDEELRSAVGASIDESVARGG